MVFCKADHSDCWSVLVNNELTRDSPTKMYLGKYQTAKVFQQKGVFYCYMKL